MTTHGDGTPAQRRRHLWAQNLRTVLAEQNRAARDLHRLLILRGVDVSQQAVHGWLAATYAPSPEHRQAIAAVLDRPQREIFPAEAEHAA